MDRERLSYLQIHPKDNVLVALRDLPSGFEVEFGGQRFILREAVRAKHKFTIYPLAKDADVLNYDDLASDMDDAAADGVLISTGYFRHASDDCTLANRDLDWVKRDIDAFGGRTFNRFYRRNGTLGAANHWLVIPLV